VAKPKVFFALIYPPKRSAKPISKKGHSGEANPPALSGKFQIPKPKLQNKFKNSKENPEVRY
jgi:hypothetical protein